MSSKLAVFSFILVSSLSSEVLCQNLQKGIVKNTDDSYELTQTKSDKAYAYGTALLSHKKLEDRGVSSFIIRESKNDVISLSRSMKIYITDLSTDSIEGPWETVTYDYHVFLGGEYSAAAEYIADVHGQEFSKPDDPMALVLDRTPTYAPLSFSTADSQYGCLEKNPLRYGDLTGDGERELVITTNYNIIIFSLSESKVTFSAHYFQNDELTEEEKENWNIINDQPSDPVYVASSITDVMDKAPLLPAWRSLSKLYFGSFEGDDTQDIILWRKVFQSPLNSDDEEGFLRLGERFVHYQYEGDQYEIQPTESEQAEQWLVDAELTWQKGYPSKSECEGEEGELIPEMHDPQLNDPDVLQ